MVINDILKVLYAPHRAFSDIVKSPRYLGPLLILVIFVVAQVGSAYVVADKSFVEQTMPVGDQGDLWTENAALWQANPGVVATNNHLDFINATGYFNNTSIEFAADDHVIVLGPVRHFPFGDGETLANCFVAVGAASAQPGFE